jgi:hypothetical protein
MAQYVSLTRGYVAVVDDADWAIISARKWYADVAQSGLVYAATKIQGKRVRMHRLLLDAVDGDHVDHTDGNGLNNQRSNIRIVTHAENMQNKKRYKNNKTGHKGVTMNVKSGQWIARIQAQKQSYFLGTFDALDRAVDAYAKAAESLRGQIGAR